MLAKKSERKKAIKLRKEGLSYSEIASRLLVSQASLSLWLRDIKLSKVQVEKLSIKKINGQAKGAKIRHEKRIIAQEKILKDSVRQIKILSRNDLFLLGIMAYWCEGAKQKENNVSQAVVFSNSDPLLIKLFIKWLKEICFLTDEDLKFSLYIHENANVIRAINFWSNELNIPKEKFNKPIFKRHIAETKRNNIGKSYVGLLRVTVRKSTNLNRQIEGWVKGIGNFIN